MSAHHVDLEISTSAHGNAVVLAITGSIDTFTADDVVGAFQSAMEGGRRYLIGDPSGVDYTSSAGLRALLMVTKETRRKGGDLRLAGVTERVHKVLEMSGYTSILRLYPDVAAALESFSSR